jgi:hypothetical protein
VGKDVFAYLSVSLNCNNCLSAAMAFYEYDTSIILPPGGKDVSLPRCTAVRVLSLLVKI